MKIKSLLIGMLACTALVGCTDDDVLGGGENQPQYEKVTAYVSLAVNTATNSSRGETSGDTDGTAEDSGHKNEGTTDESAVKNVLYILAHTGEGNDDGIIEKNGGTALSKTFQVQSEGTYDALVVLNPVQELLSAITGNMTPRQAYEKVLSFDYSEVAASNDEAMAAYTKNGFMMANQTAVQIPVTVANNSPEAAASGVINVERAIAKITFREKAAEGSTPANTYTVTINKDVYEPVAEYGWYISAAATEGAAAEWSRDQFNSANNGAVWVRVKKDLNPSDLGQVLAKDFSTTFEGIYTKTSESHTGYVQNVAQTNNIYTPVTTEPAQIVLDKGAKKENGKEETYYVKLEKYALTNLSKSIYAVRHKTSDWNTITPMGQLGTSEYLVDPKSTAKNNEDITPTWNNGGTYFYNELSAVITEAESLPSTSALSYFKDLSTLSAQTPQDVTGSAAGEPTEIGQFMSYCFENAVTKEKQLNGLVTGIVFSGQIYTDAACTNAVDVMYKYKGEFYRELRDLLANNENDTNLSGLTDLSTDDDAAAVDGLDVYKDGKCFYYANEIKHFDNNSATERGIMEFAIMRNNIYSLAINTISSIGSSTVEPVVSDPAEDEGAYITMTANILPWIVRFNDINF